MELYGFTISQVGLPFLGESPAIRNACLPFANAESGIGLGQVLALCSQPLWRRHYAKNVAANGDVPTPEMRLTQSKLGGLLVPGGPCTPFRAWFGFANVSIKAYFGSRLSFPRTCTSWSRLPPVCRSASGSS